MRKFYILIGFLFIGWLSVTAQDSLLIQGVKYKSDTLIHRHDVGLRTMHTYYRLPDLPLLVNVLEVDAQNPFIRFETCLSYDTIKGLERPSVMALRKSTEGHTAFAAINGDFYNTASPNQGHPVNGQALQGELAKKPHSSRSVVAFTDEKIPFIDVMTFSGTCFSGTESYPVSDVNNTRNTDDLILFNSYFGGNTRTNKWGTEVIATITEGSWKLNHKMQLKVEEVRINQGSTPIPQNKVILSGHGNAAALLNELEPGETVELEMKMKLKSLPELAPKITELVGGDRAILKDGVVLDNNWPELHPRTAIGFSADKSKIIMVVVDGRSNYSKGVSTKQLADIIKQSGAADALNLDGGGSSVMVVRNEIKNTPSDGVERAVGNALLVISNAIPGEAKTMQLNAEHITIPFGKKYQVKGSTFDENGEVVQYLNATNIDYQIIGEIGEIDASGLFTASGTSESGAVVGTWNGISDTMQVKLIPAKNISFSVNSLVIDHLNEYTFNVYGTGADADGDTYQMDNDIVNFTSADTTIGTVSGQGIFRGKTDGLVEIIVSTGFENQTDTCLVSVEIGRGNVLLDNFSEPDSWEVSLSHIDHISLTREIHPVYNEEMLKVDYEFTYSNRTASITLSKEIDIYGMPDSLFMEAAGSGYRSSYFYLLDHSYGLCQVPTFSDSTFQKKKAAIRTSQFKQEDYPIPLASIRLNVERDPSYVSGNRYNGTFWLKGIYAVYPEKDVQNQIFIPKQKSELLVFPNPATDGFYLQTNQNEPGLLQLNIYAITGELIRNETININESGKTPYISVNNLHPGIYFIVLKGTDSTFTGRIIVSP
jgi:hypothetical protein